LRNERKIKTQREPKKHGKYFAIFSWNLSVIKWHFEHSKECRIDRVAMQWTLVFEEQILSTYGTGQKVRTLSDHFRKSKQWRRAAKQGETVPLPENKRGREREREIKYIAARRRE